MHARLPCDRNYRVTGGCKLAIPMKRLVVLVTLLVTLLEPSMSLVLRLVPLMHPWLVTLDRPSLVPLHGSQLVFMARGLVALVVRCRWRQGDLQHLIIAVIFIFGCAVRTSAQLGVRRGTDLWSSFVSVFWNVYSRPRVQHPTGLSWMNLWIENDCMNMCMQLHVPFCDFVCTCVFVQVDV